MMRERRGIFLNDTGGVILPRLIGMHIERDIYIECIYAFFIDALSPLFFRSLVFIYTAPSDNTIMSLYNFAPMRLARIIYIYDEKRKKRTP